MTTLTVILTFMIRVLNGICEIYSLLHIYNYNSENFKIRDMDMLVFPAYFSTSVYFTIHVECAMKQPGL